MLPTHAVIIDKDVLGRLSEIDVFGHSGNAARAWELLVAAAENGRSVSLSDLRAIRSDGRELTAYAARALMYRIRQQLTLYFDSHPTHGPRVALRVSKGCYSIKIDDSLGVPTDFGPLRKFWAPHVECPPDKWVLKTSDRLFQRLGRYYYFRDVSGRGVFGFTQQIKHRLREMAAKDPSAKKVLADLTLDGDESLSSIEAERLKEDLLDAVARAVCSRLGGGKVSDDQVRLVRSVLRSDFTPQMSRHYVSAGEARGLAFLAEMFHLLSSSLNLGTKADADTKEVNLIQVGIPRASKWVTRILEAAAWIIRTDKIERRWTPDVLVVGDLETRAFDDDSFTHVDEEGVTGATKYVLVTRVRQQNGFFITAITSSHGRATEAVCQFLADSNKVSSLMTVCKWDSMPSDFQLVFKVVLCRPSNSDRRTFATEVRLAYAASGIYKEPHLADIGPENLASLESPVR